jgi:hypothetical protein
MTITGIMPLRNAVKLQYPFELAIKSLRPLCDEVLILVDPTSEDDTCARVRALADAGFVDTIVESAWDMGNHRGHVNCEISVQTAKVCAAASGDWIMSLQADEVLHEDSAYGLRKSAMVAEQSFADHGQYAATGIELRRLYFHGGLGQYRQDWTQWLLRLFKRGLWRPDIDGAMKFDPVNPIEKRWQIPHHIFHYSRVGDPQVIAERVRNLDGFFHAPAAIQSGRIAPYDFTRLRKLDTYVKDAPIEVATDAVLSDFDPAGHPAGVREYFDGL